MYILNRFKYIYRYLPIATLIYIHLSLPIYAHHLVVTTKSTLVSPTGLGEDRGQERAMLAGLNSTEKLPCF